MNLQIYISGPQSLEYTVLINNYSKLVDSLSVKKLTHHFVSHKIISTKDEEEILRPSTSTIRANTLILNKVVNPLKAGFKNCSDGFYKFLNIIEEYDSFDNKSLILSIRNQLSSNNGKTGAVLKCFVYPIGVSTNCLYVGIILLNHLYA